MTEPTPHDGQQPAEPPRIPEQRADHAYTGEREGDDDTPQRGMVRPDQDADGETADRGASAHPPAEPTTAIAAAAAGVSAQQPPPPGQPTPPVTPGQPAPPAGAPASQPGQYGTGQQGQAPLAAGGGQHQPFGSAGQPPSGPGGPGYGGQPPGGPGGPPPSSPDSPKKKSGLLVAGLIALVVALMGALTFVVTQIGGDDEGADDPPDTRPEDEEDEPDDTQPPDTEPPPTDPPTDGSVDGVFVRIDARTDMIPDEDIQATLAEIGLASGDNPVSTTDAVRNLCAALPIDEPASASAEWTRDSAPISSGVTRVLEAPADGNCINNNGEPLQDGAYEVSFTDNGGGMTTVALFTIGAATVTQSFTNDTEADLCTVDVGPTSAGFYQAFELPSGEPLAPGDSILIDVADVEHEARGLDCDGEPRESFFFTPTDGDVSLTDGSLIELVPETTTTTTTTAPPVVELTDFELNSLDGEIGSLDVAIASPAEQAVVLDILASSEERLRLATTDTSLALCAAWPVDGALAADVVWEFNRVEVARLPATVVDGVIGVCVPPGGAEFDEGAYQAYLQRGEIISSVETFTVGREETQLAFRNDTGMEICEVGFSPNLTNWYSFYEFAESSDFEGALQPGDTFTIVAPFIENDIRARDCDGNNVSEAFDIPPTDQLLNLTTGLP